MNVKMFSDYVSQKSEYVSPRYMRDSNPVVMNVLKRLGLDNLERMSMEMYDNGFSKFDRLMEGDTRELEKSLEPYTKNAVELAKELKSAKQKAESDRKDLDEWTKREAEKQNKSYEVKGYHNPL